MRLEERFKSMSLVELIDVIERPEAYTDEAREIAKEVFKSKNVVPATTTKLASEFWESYCKSHIKEILYEKKKLISHFIEDKALNEFIRLAYEYHKERQELFEIDLKKYWGAVFQ